MSSNTAKQKIGPLHVLLLVANIMIILGTEHYGYEDSHNLQAFLMTNYSKILTPRFNQSESVEVFLDLFLNSVIDFNPVSRVMTFSAVFTIKWTDEIIKSSWQDSDYFKINMTKIGMHTVWLPKIFIRNTANIDPVSEFLCTPDSEMSDITYQNTGEAIMTCLSVLQTTCKMDLTHYPADNHTCDITVVTFDAFQAIHLQTTELNVVNHRTYHNPEWTITSGVKTNSVNTFSGVNFAVILKRKSTFLEINLVIPVITITFFNGMSCFIPIESGDRLSFVTSIMLMFIVFLTTIIDLLPSTDNEISVFNFFVSLQLFYSFFSVSIAITTIYMFNLPTTKKVPKFLQTMSWKFLKIFKIENIKISNLHSPNQTYSESNINVMNDEDITPELNWRDVSRVFDAFIRRITVVVLPVGLLWYLVYCSVYLDK